MISKIFNLRHASIVSLIENCREEVVEEYFQFGLPHTSNPKIRGSMLLLASRAFIDRNHASIARLELVDVLGCKLQLVENSERFQKFDASSFSVSHEYVRNAISEICQYLDKQDKLVINSFCMELKSLLADYLKFPSELDRVMWREVPTFLQLCFTGPVTYTEAEVEFCLPNCYETLVPNLCTSVHYYNPRGGIESAVNEYLLNRNIRESI